MTTPHHCVALSLKAAQQQAQSSTRAHLFFAKSDIMFWSFALQEPFNARIQGQQTATEKNHSKFSTASKGLLLASTPPLQCHQSSAALSLLMY